MTATIATRVIDATRTHYRDLNNELRRAAESATPAVELSNVCGQRYLGTGLNRPIDITIRGTPGNDLAAFMDGPHITVYGNAQDGLGNTMNGGDVTVHGRAGDAVAHSMRGGSLWIEGDVGYRAGIHMKEYVGQRPLVVVGGTAQDFCGEYMAGGVMVLLGLNGEPHSANFIGTGMHGGAIYVRGDVADEQLGREVGRVPLTDEDRALLREVVIDFSRRFHYDALRMPRAEYIKLVPLSFRPYGRLCVLEGRPSATEPHRAYDLPLVTGSRSTIGYGALLTPNGRTVSPIAVALRPHTIFERSCLWESQLRISSSAQKKTASSSSASN